MSTNRLFGMVYYLLNHQKTTTAALAAHFEVSTRTICRDINTLSSVGIPIYTETGRSGGVYLLSHFILDKVFLSKEEQNNMLTLLKGTRQINPQMSDQSFDKLSALFDKSFDDWLEIDFTAWYQNNRHDEKFTRLKNSILNKTQIKFSYASKNGLQERCCCPYKLIFKSQAWYLQAFDLDKDDFRNFKINRMSSVEVLHQNFQSILPPEKFEQNLSRKMMPVKLVFTKEVFYRVYDEFDHNDILEIDANTVNVQTQLPDEEWLVQYLLSFGRYFKVLEPTSIKQHMQSELDAVYDNLIN